MRRLFIFVKGSIYKDTQRVVFESNDGAMRAKIYLNIINFLIGVWRSGALMGTTQDKAFCVRCDRTTMAQDYIDDGRLICQIGVPTFKPAEFVIFRIRQNTTDAAA